MNDKQALNFQSESPKTDNVNNVHAHQAGNKTSQAASSTIMNSSTSTKERAETYKAKSDRLSPLTWQRRVTDTICTYFLSDEFKSSAQLAAGNAVGLE